MFNNENLSIIILIKIVENNIIVKNETNFLSLKNS